MPINGVINDKNKPFMRNNSIKKAAFRIVDFLLVPFSYIFLPFFRLIRKYGVQHFPLNLRAFLKIGVFPIRDHYYEPQLTYSPTFDAQQKRPLAIDFDMPGQLNRLQDFQKYAVELESLSVHNPSFGAGDAEVYYLMIRNSKPKRVIEIGSGFSTLLALEAISKNKAEGFTTELTCIEPYEKEWLAEIKGITLIRKPVEQVPVAFFQLLGENDILFIDSSHIIRPENDVLFEYLQLLPALHKGVLIHIHDIFSPRHYRKDWLTELYRFWNEQYLLEAFLYYNEAFQILFSLNYLKNDYFTFLQKTCIYLRQVDQPSSFWLQKK